MTRVNLPSSSSILSSGLSDPRHSPQNLVGRKWFFVAVNNQPMWLRQYAHSVMAHEYLVIKKNIEIWISPVLGINKIALVETLTHVNFFYN